MQDTQGDVRMESQQLYDVTELNMNCLERDNHCMCRRLMLNAMHKLLLHLHFNKFDFYFAGSYSFTADSSHHIQDSRSIALCDGLLV